MQRTKHVQYGASPLISVFDGRRSRRRSDRRLGSARRKLIFLLTRRAAARPAPSPWVSGRLLCLLAADPVTNMPSSELGTHCVDDPAASRLIRELAPKHPRIGVAACVWLASGKRFGLKPGEWESGPGYAIEAQYVADMAHWCETIVTDGRAPILRKAWQALFGETKFDAGRLSEAILPHIRSLEQYCALAAERRLALLAVLRARNERDS